MDYLNFNILPILKPFCTEEIVFLKANSIIDTLIFNGGSVVANNLIVKGEQISWNENNMQGIKVKWHMKGRTWKMLSHL